MSAYASQEVRFQPLRRAAGVISQIDRIKVCSAVLIAQIVRALEILWVESIAPSKIRSRPRWRAARPDKAMQCTDRHKIPTNGVKRPTPRKAAKCFEENADAANDHPRTTEDFLDKRDNRLCSIG